MQYHKGKLSRITRTATSQTTAKYLFPPLSFTYFPNFLRTITSLPLKYYFLLGFRALLPNFKDYFILSIIYLYNFELLVPIKILVVWI